MKMLDDLLFTVFWDRTSSKNTFSPRYLFSAILTWLVCTPILWLAMKTPSLWPAVLTIFSLLTCLTISIKPCKDWLRAAIALFITLILLEQSISFGAMFSHYHIEKTLYWLIIICSCVALLRRFWNWFAWKQVNRLSDKYNMTEGRGTACRAHD